MQSGAQDYLVKGQIDTRQLTRSIRYAIERQKLITELEESRKEIKTLQGLLPMCAWCREIRDDKGYWKNLETYIQENTDAAFTDGICPKCLKKRSSRTNNLQMINKLLRNISSGYPCISYDISYTIDWVIIVKYH